MRCPCSSEPFLQVLWCMFSGRQHPWADSPVPVDLRFGFRFISAIIAGRRPDMGALYPDTPPLIKDLMERCWAHHHAMRPSALAVAEATGRALAEAFLPIPPPLGEAPAAHPPVLPGDARAGGEPEPYVLIAEPVHPRELPAPHAAAAVAALPPPPVHEHSAACNHSVALDGIAWAAALRGDVPALEAALSDGCSTEEMRSDGETAILAAAREGQASAIRTLISAGADISAVNYKGSNCLMMAAYYGRELVVAQFLNLLDPNARDKKQFTPLHGACYQGHAACIRLLLADARIDVNAQGYDGRTPLHDAVDGNRPEAVRILLADGRVNTSTRDAHGLTALDLAHTRGRPELVSLLV